MDNDKSEEPPNSNEEWFNQESDNILHETIEVATAQAKLQNRMKTADIQSAMPETQDGERKAVDNIDTPSTIDIAVVDEVVADGRDNDLKNEISPDELDVGNETLPIVSSSMSEFRDDQDVEIINAFKQDDGYDQECIEPDATVNNEFAGVEASTSKSVCAGNESDQEDSDATEVSNKTVQTEQAAHRQQSCSSRASLDSQRSISFFVEFDDCDINANDTVFSDKTPTHRRIKHKKGDTMSSKMNDTEASKEVTLEDIKRKIDDRTITRRNKGSDLKYRAQSAKDSSRMTQSMYVIGRSSQQSFSRSDSQSSGVSFFVDLSDFGESKPMAEKEQRRIKSAQRASKKVDEVSEKSKKMVKSMSREEWSGAKELEETSDDMRAKSRLLLSRNLDQTKTFFKKLKEYINFLSAPSYSKDELRQKKQMAEKITRLMFEEEQRLGKGFTISDERELDQILLGANRQNEIPTINNKRPLSAYNAKTNSENDSDRPTPLRREKTFDLDPKATNKDAKLKLTDIPIDFGPAINEHGHLRMADPAGIQMSDLENAITSPEVMTSLQMFQQQRLLHTKRLRREIARLEQMEKEIAIKTTQISEMVTPEPKSRNGWTPGSSSRRENRSDSQTTTRLADRNAIAQGHSRSSGRLSSDEKRLLQSSHSNRSEKVQTQNERHKQSRKTTFQTVANNQESQSPMNQNSNCQDLTQLNRPGKFNVTIREKIDQTTYAERPTSSGASSACSWFISNDTQNARIGTDSPGLGVLQDADRIMNENAVHILGGPGSQLLCSNRDCGNQLSTGENIERAPSVSRGMQTGNSLLRQYKEKKDKGCWVRPGPQAYYLVCEAPENTEERQEEGSRSAWWENEAPREGNEQSNPNTPLEPPSIERSRTASPYIENNVGGTGTVVRRRVIDQVPRDPATKIIDLETDEVPKEQNLQEALRLKRPDYIARTKDREQNRMARSVVISKKANGSDTKGKNNVKMRGSSNLMTSSMPSSVLTKTLYSNGSAASQRNNNSIDVMNKSIPNRRNQISKSHQNKSEGKIKDSKPNRNGQNTSSDNSKSVANKEIHSSSSPYSDDLKTQHQKQTQNVSKIPRVPSSPKQRSGSIDEKRNANPGASNNSKSSDLSNPPIIKQPLGPNTATIYSKTSSMQKTNKQGPEIRRRQKIIA